jgi:hypothetical protein
MGRGTSTRANNGATLSWFSPYQHRANRTLQHPLAEAYFLSLEDEFGFLPLIVWPGIYERYKRELREPFMLVEGTVSKREGTLNIVVHRVTIPKILGSSVVGSVKLPRPIFRLARTRRAG